MTKILIIDDEVAIAEALRIRLSAAGFTAITSNDGEEGIAKAKSESPDLILLDIRMPGMDGFEVLHHIRNASDLQEIPVILLSAHAQEEAQRRAAEDGAQGFIAKPYNVSHLISTIKSVLEEKVIIKKA